MPPPRSPSPTPSQRVLDDLGAYHDEEIAPDEHLVGDRRRLLLIYVHGFMGNDTSFQSFPAHVHDCLKVSLDSHVIHTKIYPRYKTYKAFDLATVNFSKWLAPHESPNTDIVLLGHSMGGLLVADTVLLPHPDAADPPFRHNILGTVSLDCPFMGLHPGIIGTGIASLFRKNGAPKSPAGTATPGTATPEAPAAAPPGQSSSDPYFNPPWYNDVQFKDKGWKKNLLHFVKKRQMDGSDLIEAATNHIICHMQYGRNAMDKRSLDSRYERIRRLEDVNEYDLSRNRRVRFVNYYTVATGRPKTPKPRSRAHTPPEDSSTSMPLLSPEPSKSDEPAKSAEPSAEPAKSAEPSAEPAKTAEPSAEPAKTAEPSAEPSPPRISIEDHSETANPKLLEELDQQLQPVASASSEQDQEGPKSKGKQKKEKLRKFCTLPSKVNGVRDSAWIRVHMEGMDEVEAHTSLFKPECAHYGKLVGEVGSTIVDWVQHEATRRTIMGLR